MTDNAEHAFLLAAMPDAHGLHAAIHVPSFESTVGEEGFTLRYGKDRKKYSDLIFEFTRDPALIHQYHRIYEEEFRLLHNAPYYHEENDEHDHRGHFLIIRSRNLCVGGARLSIKTPRQPNLLPIEMGEFRLEEHFPQLRHQEKSYGQIGRLCVLPDYRGGSVTRLMLSHLYRKAIALGLDMVFGTAPLVIARSYMKNFVSIGLKETKVHFDITLPLYPMCEEIRFYLISAMVQKLQEDQTVCLAEHQAVLESND